LSEAQSVRDRGAWIQTYTGRKFHYNDPQPEDVHLQDIAHALSNMCRYAGHCDKFYSVAEHSVLLSNLFEDPTTRMIALLHDATEAYCVDIPRPLKRMLPDYTAYEESVWKIIARRFGLPEEIPAEVHEMDTRMLMTERPQIFRQVIPWPKYEDILPIDGVHVQGMRPEIAKATFIVAYENIRDLRDGTL
jgi:hypothetical protein